MGVVTLCGLYSHNWFHLLDGWIVVVFTSEGGETDREGI